MGSKAFEIEMAAADNRQFPLTPLESGGSCLDRRDEAKIRREFFDGGGDSKVLHIRRRHKILFRIAFENYFF
jgi:hypothetical protein